jgi:hypothetical protein
VGAAVVRGLAMADLFSLLAGDDPSAQARAEALSRLMKQRQGYGTILALTGDRTLAPVGQGLAREGAEAPEQIAGLMNQRAGRALQARGLEQQQGNADRAYALDQRRAGLDERRLGLEGQKIDQDNWGAIADPVTGGVVMFNRKSGEVRPLGPGGGEPMKAPTGAPLPTLPGKPTEDQRKKVAGASESISQLDMAIQALDKAPGAYGGVGNFVAGLAESAGGTPVQSLTSRRYNPDELRVKNYVSNVVSKIINERAGANVTLREELRQKFLPQDTDGLDQAKQKLTDLRSMMGATYEAQGGALVPDVNPAAPASGAAPVRRFRRVDGKLVEDKP